MKKVFLMALMVLWAPYATAQASVTFNGSPDGGTFATNSIYYIYDLQTGMEVANTTYKDDPFASYPGKSFTMNGEALLGPNPTNGLAVQTTAQQYFKSPGNIALETNQLVHADANEFFQVDTPGNYQFTGSLTGPVDFPLDAFKAYYSQASYTVTGTTFIQPFTLSATRSLGDAQYLFDFTAADLADQQPRTATAWLSSVVNGEAAKYLLVLRLEIHSKLKNYDFNIGIDPTPVDQLFDVGNLVLTTSVANTPSTAPIPNSLLLLSSGFGALAFLRLRRRRTGLS